MKLLRALYMITAGLLLLPVILIIEALFFTWLIVNTKDFKETVCTWLEYLKCGIEMNIDFIKNGL